VVQDPSTALFKSIPNNAIGQVDTDFVPPEQVAGVISTLAMTDRIAKIEEEASGNRRNGRSTPTTDNRWR